LPYLKLRKALADPTRFRILQAIAATEGIACGTLAARFSITQATCSQHLKVLVDAGLIAMRRDKHGQDLLYPRGEFRRLVRC
jgi:ArsR family transcriptional regulator, arsenate/arsenite/antimonite-responsive transcriptional repressor